MPRSANRISGWQKAVLYGSSATALASGVAWLALHYGRDADPLPLPIEAWAMRLHGLAAFAILFVFGALATSHIPHGWRVSHRLSRARQRSSGLALSLLAGACVLTGYLLYYFAPEAVRPALGWLHSGLGAAAVLLAFFHRRRLQRHPQPL